MRASAPTGVAVSLQALQVVATHGPLLELGAGLGHWEKQLRERGADILAGTCVAAGLGTGTGHTGCFCHNAPHCPHSPSYALRVAAVLHSCCDGHWDQAHGVLLSWGALVMRPPWTQADCA